MNLENLKSLIVIKEPIPHIPERHILTVIGDNKELLEKYENWARGKTGLMCSDGDFGLYEWDFNSFIYLCEEIKRVKKIV